MEGQVIVASINGESKRITYTANADLTKVDTILHHIYACSELQPSSPCILHSCSLVLQGVIQIHWNQQGLHKSADPGQVGGEED